MKPHRLRSNALRRVLDCLIVQAACRAAGVILVDGSAIKDVPECLAMFREAMSKQGERNDLDNNVIHVGTPQGNSRAYSIDRVKRARLGGLQRIK